MSNFALLIITERISKTQKADITRLKSTCCSETQCSTSIYSIQFLNDVMDKYENYSLSKWNNLIKLRGDIKKF